MNAKLTYKAFPVGACVACLTQWRDQGFPGQQQPLESGELLLTGYCSHHEAGLPSPPRHRLRLSEAALAVLAVS